MSISKAVILAGGKGTRLRPLTFNIPKPLLPVGEKSILEILAERLRGCGLREIILSVGYRADLIRAFCGDGSQFGVHFTYVEEDEPLGTAGPLALARELIEPDEGLLLMNGDIVTELDFNKLVRFHEQEGADLTIAYKEMRETSPFGVLKIEEQRLQAIEEKPVTTFSVSSGIYVVGPQALAQIPSGSPSTMPELAERLMAQGRPVATYRIDEFWLGVERFPHLEDALRALEDVDAPAEPPVAGSSLNT